MKLILFLVFCNFLNALNSEETKFKSDTDFENDYIYACGEEFLETKCKCDGSALNSGSSRLKNLNIHILAENFTPKVATFKSNYIKELKKREILPGREYSIQTLILTFNSISTIENGTFDEFKSLQELDLSYNKLKNFDENVLTSSLGGTLLSLDLSWNNLQQISPTTFIFLTKLESLNLAGNEKLFPFFNKNVFSTSLSSLKILNLGHCNIKDLDYDAFFNLKNLTKIVLHKNPMATVPKALNILFNLQDLDLSYTEITSINRDTFGYNPKLTDLHLYTMPNLTAINDCAFCKLPNLKVLVFVECEKLAFIHENAFGSISSGKLYSKMKEFCIARTKISTVPEGLLDWAKADKLMITTDEFSCDCSTAWLVNDLQNSILKTKLKKSFGGQKYTCHNPPEFRNKSLIEVSGKICNGKMSTIYPSSSSSTFNLYWIFLVVIIFGIAVFCYIYQSKIIKFVFRRKQESQNGDTDQLYHYRNLEVVSISM